MSFKYILQTDNRKNWNQNRSLILKNEMDEDHMIESNTFRNTKQQKLVVHEANEKIETNDISDSKKQTIPERMSRRLKGL